jgi:hypothetical protein
MDAKILKSCSTIVYGDKMHRVPDVPGGRTVALHFAHHADIVSEHKKEGRGPLAGLPSALTPTSVTQRCKSARRPQSRS